jgi:hypothetical protein
MDILKDKSAWLLLKWEVDTNKNSLTSAIFTYTFTKESKKVF